MTVYPESRNARAAARDSYGRGLPVNAIAQTLNVSVMSILRWRQQDMEAGMSWTGPARPQSAESGAAEPQLRELLRSQLQTHLAELVRQALNAESKGRARYPTVEDRMLKVCRVIEHLDPDTDDPGIQLAVMQGFAAFCVRALSEQEIGPVRKAVRLFLDDLKARHQ
jgi:transposase